MLSWVLLVVQMSLKESIPKLSIFQTVSMQELFYEVATPDSQNINAYVVDTNEYPEEAVCVLPDRNVVSESLLPEETFYIIAIEPTSNS